MEFTIRRANRSDVDDIAMVHRDSIQSIGPSFYSPDVVEAWAEGLSRDVYTNAMEAGEVFFIAIGEVDSKRTVLGFSSDYLIEDSRHGLSVYVRGIAARQGVGSSLLRAAETHAIAKAATCIEIDASLAAVQFYKRHGFEEIGRGETRLMSGRPIACVFMQKTLPIQ